MVEGASVVVVCFMVVVVGGIVVVVVDDSGLLTASGSADGRLPLRHWTFLGQSHPFSLGRNWRLVGQLW